MSFAVVELKYMPKKTFIVPISWIQNYMRTHSSTVEFYCFISTNLKDNPNFTAKYYMKFNGTAGLFKVFILKVTDSVIDAISYQEQKRVKSIPQKFRQPGNTDVELSVENIKRKKKENVIKKASQRNAKAKNMAHLAVLLGNATTSNVAAQNSIPEVNIHNVRIDGPENNSLTDVIPTEFVGNRIQQKQAIVPPAEAIVAPAEVIVAPAEAIVAPAEAIVAPAEAIVAPAEAIVAPVDAIVIQKSPNHVRVPEIECKQQPMSVPAAVPATDIESQPANYSYDSSSVTIPPINEGDMAPNDAHTFVTGIESQPFIIAYDLASTPMTSNASLIETGIQNAPSGTTNYRPDIVRLALEGWEGIDSASVSGIDFPGGMDIDFADEYRCGTIVDAMSESVQNLPNSVLVDVHLNACNFGNDQETDNSLSTHSSVSKQHKEVTLPFQERHEASVQEFDYKKAYLQQKEKNVSLDERNLALQNALVAADKALGKVPEIPYASVDGGRLYREGVYLDEVQCKILDTTSDNNKYVNNLAVAVFGTEILRKSSVTGTASKNKKVPAKPGLNPLWLQLVYDLTDAKTNKRMSVSDVNKILNKKISNLNGADKRKLAKLNGEANRNLDERNSGRNLDERNSGESGKVGDVAAPTEK